MTTTLFRLTRMRRSTAASRLQAIRWAAGLLWRDFVGSMAFLSPARPRWQRPLADPATKSAGRPSDMPHGSLTLRTDVVMSASAFPGSTAGSNVRSAARQRPGNKALS